MKNLIISVLFSIVLFNCKSIDNGNNKAPKQIIEQKNSTENLVWKQIGPSIPNEDLLDKYSDATNTYWHGEGRISSIWIDPKNDNHLLIGVSFGGLFETFDTGENWKSLTDKVPVNEIQKIIVKEDVIYISTGYRFNNPQRFSSKKYYGLGVIKSYDRGKNWQVSNSNFFCSDFSISNNNTIYAISTSSVYKSIDAGKTFIESINLFEINYLHNNFRLELNTIVVNPSNPDIAIVTAKRASNKASKMIFKTIDGGKNWVDITNQFLKKTAKDIKDVNNNYIKDAALFYNANTKKLWVHITLINARMKNKRIIKKYESYIFNSKNWINWAFVNNQKIQSGYHYSPKFYEKNGTMYIIGWYLYIKQLNDTKFINVGSGKVHQDCRAVAVNSKGLIYYGNDAGIVKSNDLGKSWKNAYKKLNANLVFEMSYYSDNNNRILDIGTQDAGYYRNILDKKTPKYPIETHEGGIYTSPHNKNRIYIKDDYVKLSVDGGLNFKPMYLNDSKKIVIMHRDGLLREDPINKNELYIGHKNELYFSNNYGIKGSWKNRTPKNSNNGRGTDIAIPKSNNNILYYANHLVTFPIKHGGFKTYVRQGHLLKSIDKGKTWVNISKRFNNLLKTSIISDVEVDQNNPDRVWFTVRNLIKGQNVFFSKNGGKTWDNISFNLPNVPVNRIEYNEKTKTVYLANDYGVYYLKNDTWLEYGTDLPKVIVNGLVVDTIYNEIIVSTFGRGVWKIDLK